MSDPKQTNPQGHVTPTIEPAGTDLSIDDFRATATAFSQVSGLLGGFSITILVLVLSKDFLTGQQDLKSWIIGLLLFAAFIYVASASFLANSMNAIVLRSFITRLQTFNFAIMLFHVANLLLAVSMIILVYQFSFLVGLIATIIIGVSILFVAGANFGLALGIIRIKK